jgi:CheY-like chemotaxis protein
MRILVVEDHAPTIEMFSEILARDGHVVVSERNGIAGRDRAIAEQFDLILCDLGLPGLDGVDIARAVRAAGIRVPMLAVTGRASEDERLVGLTAGFDTYLTKPFSATTLLREIATHDGVRNPEIALAPVRARVAEVVHAVVAPTAAAPAGVAHAAVAPAHAPAVRPRRGVLGGLVVIAMGLPFVLQPLGVPNAASYLFIAMGMAFLISFVRGRQYVYLIPMVTLSSFGIALLLPTWITMRPETVAPAFVAIVALGFLAAFVLVPARRWPLIPAALLGLVAATRLVTGSSPIPAALEPFLVPIVLVGVGLYLLIERQ